MAEPRGKGPAARISRGLLAAVGFGLLLAIALWTVPTSARRPWDFETYWYASQAASRGLSPYDTAALERLAHRPVGMPFLYAPVTVPLLTPLTLLPIDEAARVWFWLKVAATALLVLLWRRFFLPTGGTAPLVAASILGFNAACVWDLRTGNVASLEQLLLWTGFAAYALDRRRLFAVCVVAASLFKLVPIVFLALLLVPSKKSRGDWRTAGVALAAFAAIVWGPVLTGQAWARGFLHDLPPERPWGAVNPSALGLIDSLLGDHATPIWDPPFHALALWLAYAAALIAVSLPTLRRLWRAGNPREWILASAILYALLVPRLMVYSYLIVIVPTLALLGPAARRVGGAATIAVIVSAQGAFAGLFGFRYPGTWSGNAAFLLLLGVWMAYLATVRRGAPDAVGPRAAGGRPLPGGSRR
jgi:hypothetical protein